MLGSGELDDAGTPGEVSDAAIRFPPENREGSGRYPLRVRTLYFFRRSPISLTLIVRQPLFGFALG
jgi:hypothetical protein